MAAPPRVLGSESYPDGTLRGEPDSSSDEGIEGIGFNPLKPSDDFLAQVHSFELGAVEDVEDLRHQAESARDGEREKWTWKERVRLNEYRAQAQLDISVDEKGRVDPKSADGHAKEGFTHGLAARNMLTASAHLYNTIFGQREDAYDVVGRGSKGDQTESLERVLTHILRYIQIKGKLFDRAGLALCLDAPFLGTAFMRYDLTQETGMELLSDGTYREMVSGDELEVTNEEGAAAGQSIPKRPRRWQTIMPVFDDFPATDVLIGDYHKRNADEQTHIWWIQRNLTVDQLAPNEQIAEPIVVRDPQTDEEVEAVQLVGKWRNFKKLRQLEFTKQHSLNDSAESVNEEQRKASHQIKFSLIEFEGSLPWWKWIKSGSFNHEMAIYYGMGPIIGELDTEADDADEQLASKLGRILHWQFSYTGGQDARSGDGELGEQVLLQLESSPFRRSRNRLFIMPMYPDRDRPLGQSVAERGYEPEKAADTILNNELYVARFIGSPSGLINEKVLADPSDVGRIAEPGNLLTVKGGTVRVADLISLFTPPSNPNAGAQLQGLLGAHDQITGIPQISRGFGSAPTATQDQINQSNAQSLIGFIAMGSAFRLAEIQKNMLIDWFHVLGKEEAIRSCIEIAGLAAASIEDIIDDIYNEEFDVVPSFVSGNDPAVMARTLQTAIQVGSADLTAAERRGLLRKSLEEAGIRNASALLSTTKDILNTEETIAMVATGTIPRVHPLDDHARKIEEITSEIGRMVQEDGGRWTAPEFAALSKDLMGIVDQHYEMLRSQQEEQAPQGAQAPQSNTQGGVQGGSDSRSGKPTGQEAAGTSHFAQQVS